MSYSILAVRDGESDDARLYPVLGDDATPIELEAHDGSHTDFYPATSLQASQIVGDKLRSLATFEDIKADLIVTDARVAVACTKYTKGGGWVGFGAAGLAVAVTANTVSKARAARRRRGKMLVGHVRYPWLSKVGFSSRKSWPRHERLRLVVRENATGDGQRDLILEITLAKGNDASSIAADIARRAATYRLANSIIEDAQQRETFEQLSAATPLAPAESGFVFHVMPTFFHVAADTAYPALMS